VSAGLLVLADAAAAASKIPYFAFNVLQTDTDIKKRTLAVLDYIVGQSHLWHVNERNRHTISMQQKCHELVQLYG